MERKMEKRMLESKLQAATSVEAIQHLLVSEGKTLVMLSLQMGGGEWRMFAMLTMRYELIPAASGVPRTTKVPARSEGTLA